MFSGTRRQGCIDLLVNMTAPTTAWSLCKFVLTIAYVWFVSSIRRNRRYRALHGNTSPMELLNLTKLLQENGRNWKDVKRKQWVVEMLGDCQPVFKTNNNKHADAGAWYPKTIVTRIVARITRPPDEVRKENAAKRKVIFNHQLDTEISCFFNTSDARDSNI